MLLTRAFILQAIITLTLISAISFGQQQPRYADGEVVLLVKEPSIRMESRLAELGLQVMARDRISGSYRIAVPSGEESSWISELSQLGGVRAVELNALGSAASSFPPNDTHYPLQWHLDNTGQVPGTPGADINIAPAWAATCGSSTIGIAVIDSGIDSDHPEFAGRIDPNGFDYVNNDSDPEAVDPHGTWIASCMAANGDNAFGISGVDRQCRILPLQVLDSAGNGNSFNLSQALIFAASQPDIHIICMALQGFPPTAALLNALSFASQSGKILISSTSNFGSGSADTSYPGASPLTISIGFTDASDQLHPTSGTGTRVDFVAPGVDIVVARHNSMADLFTVGVGSSFATAMVSGIVGLIFAKFEAQGQALPTQDEVYALLQLGAEDQVGSALLDPPGYDSNFGHGRINAGAIFERALILDDCSSGNIDVGPNGPRDIFKINGKSRTGLLRRVVVGINQALTFEVDVPSSKFAKGTPS
ncbi:MAG: S8 family serine peptidase [Planctomycetota bacterium]